MGQFSMEKSLPPGSVLSGNQQDVARAMGLWGHSVAKAEDLEEAVKDWLAQPGPALLHVKVNAMELVMPPFVEVAPAVGMALYSTRAVLHGRGGDVWEMVKENFL
jgi:pyruvate dehydrogenase (quinone)